MIELKQCFVCKEYFSRTSEYFHKNKDGKDGFRNCCKECFNNKNKKYREDNKEKIFIRNKNYRKNKEHFNMIERKYRKLDYVKEKRKIYDKNNMIEVDGVKYNLNTCNEEIKPILIGIKKSRQLQNFLKEDSK